MSKIEWTDTTWNPVRGCSLVSDGCRNCYAMKMAHRFSGPGKPYEGLTELGPNGPRWNGKIRLVPEVLDRPLRWRKPRRVFVNSMSDLFHPDVPTYFIEKIFAIMAAASAHTFQVLTKRPERMAEFCAAKPWFCKQYRFGVGDRVLAKGTISHSVLPNVWLGVSVENQATADERIPLLLQTPAAVRFISCEPLLGPVDVADGAGVTYWDDPSAGVHWVVVGGESGPGSRPMHPKWARSLRDQCADGSIAYFFKQWGEWLPDNQLDVDCFVVRRGHPGAPPGMINKPVCNLSPGLHAFRVGKKRAGRELDGVTWDEMPV